MASLSCLAVGAFLSIASSGDPVWQRVATLEGSVDLEPDAGEVRVPLVATIDSPTALDHLTLQFRVSVRIPWEEQTSVPDIVFVNDETGEESPVSWGPLRNWTMTGVFRPHDYCEEQQGQCEASGTVIFTPRGDARVHVDWTSSAGTSAMGDDPGGAILILE